MAMAHDLPFDKQGDPTVNDFDGWEKREIIDYVLQWFACLYEDAALEMPFIDGEYFYVHGGPYDAREVLHDAFGGRLSEELVMEIADEIESDGTCEWVPSPNHPEQVAAAEEAMWEHEQWLSQHEPLEILKAAKAEIEEFVTGHLKNEETSFMHRMAFIQGWSVLEAYLFGKMVKSVQESPAAVAALYQENSDLKKRAFKGAEILESPDLIKRTAIFYLEKRTYHALKRIIPLYEQAFGKLKAANANTSEPMRILIGLITKRHDCVHRNGQSTDNKTVFISNADIKSVLKAGLELAYELEKLVEHHKTEVDFHETKADTLPF